MNLFYPLFILFLATLASSQESNAPVIGIVSIPSDYPQFPADSWSYIVGSYVKYLQQAGAQVVPIPYDLPQEQMSFLLDRVNGVLFTGGSADFDDPETGEITPFGHSLNRIVQYVIKQNKNGKYYPLWGTCMGFQAIAGFIAQNLTYLTKDCEGCHGVNKNNYWNKEYQSRLYSQLPQDLYEKMETDNLNVFVHRYMYHAEIFENTSPLNVTLKTTTFGYDTTGKKYVSSFEGVDMPIYGVQYHPEKNAFEWRSSYGINHGYDAIRLGQYLANFFVNETRKNTNVFPEQQVYLIDNYHALILPNDTYTSLYFFKKVNDEGNKQENQNAFLLNFDNNNIF